MTDFEKPVVVMSKCLGVEACRYNGEIIRDDVINRLSPYVHVIPVCPEVEIGLGTPRHPIRIVTTKSEKRLVQPATDRDVTKEMTDFTDQFLHHLPEVDGFILKSRSPSCAIKDAKFYYEGENGQVAGKGSGLFAEKVCQRFSHLAVEDEGRLKNFTIRDHFFIKLFTLAKFRAIKKTESHSNLVQFHTENKYLFMTFHPLKLKKLGIILANHEKKPVSEMFRDYEQALQDLLSRPFSYKANINVFYHIFGYFSKELSTHEKKYFLSLIDKFREKKQPKSSLVSVLYSWALRFEQEYLLAQTFFQPYPEQLMDISDSGKGRNLA